MHPQSADEEESEQESEFEASEVESESDEEESEFSDGSGSDDSGSGSFDDEESSGDDWDALEAKAQRGMPIHVTLLIYVLSAVQTTRRPLRMDVAAGMILMMTVPRRRRRPRVSRMARPRTASLVVERIPVQTFSYEPSFSASALISSSSSDAPCLIMSHSLCALISTSLSMYCLL